MIRLLALSCSCIPGLNGAEVCPNASPANPTMMMIAGRNGARCCCCLMLLVLPGYGNPGSGNRDKKICSLSRWPIYRTDTLRLKERERKSAGHQSMMFCSGSVYGFMQMMLAVQFAGGKPFSTKSKVLAPVFTPVTVAQYCVASVPFCTVMVITDPAANVNPVGGVTPV